MPGKRFQSSVRPPLRGLLPSLAVILPLALAFPHAAWALNDNKPATQDQVKDEPSAKDPDAVEDDALDDVKPTLPMPDSLIKKPDADQTGEEDKADEPAIPVEIVLDPNQLPEPVKKLRIALVEAAATGDIERLRPLLQTGPDATQVAIGDAPEDPIAALKSLSGDKDGREVLAILLDIISTSAAHIDKGTANEMYIWPYFAEKQLDTLTPPEMVELYRIVTASDVDAMKEFGSYNFYRIGISPEGKWVFFVAGD